MLSLPQTRATKLDANARANTCSDGCHRNHPARPHPRPPWSLPMELTCLFCRNSHLCSLASGCLQHALVQGECDGAEGGPSVSSSGPFPQGGIRPGPSTEGHTPSRLRLHAPPTFQPHSPAYPRQDHCIILMALCLPHPYESHSVSTSSCGPMVGVQWPPSLLQKPQLLSVEAETLRKKSQKGNGRQMHQQVPKTI